MERMTKYQYTYFIHPYVIGKSGYQRYMQKLLKNKKCKCRIFEKEKDMHLYQYFLPDIRDYMFWSFGLTRQGIRSFEELDVSLKAKLLSEKECNIFSYELPKELQGKVGEKGGIFFEISEIKIICFRTGICFLLFKTILLENNNFADVLNFNYKFREINSKTYNMKEYENIRLQVDTFKDVTEVSSIIKEITGNNGEAKKINLDNEKMLVYSYCCLDQNSWNDETDMETMYPLFEKYRLLASDSRQIADKVQRNEETEFQESNFVHYGFSNVSTVLLTNDMRIANYTTIAQKYESEYLYTYILELYKKILLKKINHEFNDAATFKKVEKGFLDFTKKLWIQEITEDEHGRKLIKKWNEQLEIENMFLKLKNKYDILYKKYNVEKVSDKNGKFAIAIVVLIVIGAVNLLIQLLK